MNATGRPGSLLAAVLGWLVLYVGLAGLMAFGVYRWAARNLPAVASATAVPAAATEPPVTLTYEARAASTAELEVAEMVVARRLAMRAPSGQVRREGTRLLVSVPAPVLADEERLDSFLRSPGVLAFVSIAREHPELLRGFAAAIGSTSHEPPLEVSEGQRATVEAALRTATPVPGFEVLPERRANGTLVRLWALDPGDALVSPEVKSARAANDEFGWQVALQLGASSSPKLLELTTRHVGQRLAIVVDGTVVCAPLVQGPIPAGAIQIQLGTPTDPAEDQQRATKDLADVLGSGRLHVTLERVER